VKQVATTAPNVKVVNARELKKRRSSLATLNTIQRLQVRLAADLVPYDLRNSISFTFPSNTAWPSF
jgi:hypothetical protein